MRSRAKRGGGADKRLKAKLRMKKVGKRKVRVPFLAGSVPDLSLNGLVIDEQSARLKFNTDGGLGVQAELVPRKPR